MPKVSIIVVNYNYSQYLDERIQSFLNQTYQDFELIIIDNGSTDDSKKIISKYEGNERVETQFFSENIHPFNRWNAAADSAKGEYLVIAAADDSCDFKLLEILVKKLDENPNVGLAFTQSWEMDLKGNRLISCKYSTDSINKERWSEDFIDEGKKECQYLFFQCTIPNPSGALLRRSIFDKAGRLNTAMKLNSDWLLWAKMLTISDIAYVAEPLNYFRQSTSGISLRQSIEDTLEEIKERLEVYHYLIEAGVEPLESFWERTYYPTMRGWLKLMLQERGSFRLNLRIYRLLRDINPRLHPRLLRSIFDSLQRKLLCFFQTASGVNPTKLG